VLTVELLKELKKEMTRERVGEVLLLFACPFSIIFCSFVGVAIALANATSAAKLEMILPTFSISVSNLNKLVKINRKKDIKKILETNNRFKLLTKKG
jgi:hypothetical protein